MSFFYSFLCQQIWISWLQENAFQTHFLTSKHTLSIADKHHFPCKYYGLVIKYTKSHHPNWCIKVGNTPASLPCWWVVLIFFCNQVWQGQSVMFRLKLLLLKITLQPLFMEFLWWGSTVSRLQSHCEETLFTTPPLGLPGTHLVNLRSTKGWVTLDISKFRTPTLRIQHLNCSFRLTHLLFICEQTLFNFSNIQLEQQLHLQHSPFFIHPAIWNTTTLFKQLNKAKVY